MDDEEKKNAIKNEIFILKQLKNENIMKLYDVVNTNNHLFLILEYIEGISLLDYIREKGGIIDEKDCKPNNLCNGYNAIKANVVVQFGLEMQRDFSNFFSKLISGITKGTFFSCRNAELPSMIMTLDFDCNNGIHWRETSAGVANKTISKGYCGNCSTEYTGKVVPFMCNLASFRPNKCKRCSTATCSIISVTSAFPTKPVAPTIPISTEE